MRHWMHDHVKWGHRILFAVALMVGGFLGWWFTHLEVYYKLFEFSAAPFMDKILFGVGESS